MPQGFKLSVNLLSKHVVSTQYSGLGGLYDAYRGYSNYRLLPSEYLLSEVWESGFLIRYLISSYWRGVWLDVQVIWGGMEVYTSEFESIIQLLKFL